MEYKKTSFGGYNLHLIKTDKFKNCHIEVVFRNTLNSEEITKRQFLTRILCESNSKYPTRRKLLMRFEDLYDSSVYGTTNRVGASIITSICADFLTSDYTLEDTSKDVIDLLFTTIFSPLVKNCEFDNKTFNLIKNQMEDSIKSTLENPKKLALINALKELNNPLYLGIGDLNDLNNITPDNLYDYYENMLKNDYVDIFVVGNVDMNKITKYISAYANFNVIKTHPVKMYIESKKSKTKTVSCDNYAAQSHIVVILSYDNLTDYENKYVANIYNMILGGGSLQTKLYKKLRNDNSLCYNVNSFYQKYDRLIIITTAVDPNQVSKAIKLIKESLKEMSNNITNDELNNAKELTISSLNYIKDNIERIVDNIYFEDLNEVDNLETRIKTYNSISLEDLYSFSKKINIKLIYTLKGGQNE